MEKDFRSEVDITDGFLAEVIDQDTRHLMWKSSESILSKGPVDDLNTTSSIGLALGYVQSGKTSSIASLIALAADKGYRIIVALLGNTNLLLSQNQERLKASLGVDRRSDYKWIVEENPEGRSGGESFKEWLARDRTIFVPILKHPSRISGVAEALSRNNLSGVPVLFIDDEADQASLNTEGDGSESTTYASISELRNSAPQHLYVQYTATPYAPLLLEHDDMLLPEFVEFLTPGPSYVGGREFFIDFHDVVVRPISDLDKQKTDSLPAYLPESLQTALGSFIAGASILLAENMGEAPVSMLVHSSQLVDVQSHYHRLIKHLVNEWREVINSSISIDGLPKEIVSERERLVSNGVEDIDDEEFIEMVRYVLSEVTLWLVNSESDQGSVDWHIAPIHILVGGNKLDRGFTIEGLTVTYMNRSTSSQMDTMEQRARAFGYRQDLLPFCQFFATRQTINVLRDVVFTEYDLRAKLQDHISEDEGTVSSWAREVGLLLPVDTKPTRPNVVKALSKTTTGWHSMRRPSLDPESLMHNRKILESLGLFEAEFEDYGRQEFRTVHLNLSEVVNEVFENWKTHSYSPGWRHDLIVQSLARNPNQDQQVPILLLEENGSPRIRKWDDGLGFVNLFQGRDLKNIPGRPFYPGDRAVPKIDENPDDVVVQFHRVIRRDREDSFEILAPAVYLGRRSIIRKN